MLNRLKFRIVQTKPRMGIINLLVRIENIIENLEISKKNGYYILRIKSS